MNQLVDISQYAWLDSKLGVESEKGSPFAGLPEKTRRKTQMFLRHLLLLTWVACLAACLIPSESYAKDERGVDEKIVASAMTTRGMKEPDKVELLLDRHGEYSYCIGYSSSGYLILNRKTGLFMEQGGGTGPYSEDAEKKYYGGFLCYAQDAGNGLVDPRNGKKLLAIPYCPAAERAIVEASTEQGADEILDMLESQTVVGQKALSNETNLVEGIAFGNNSSSDEEYVGTCSAVAVGIALNYLDISWGEQRGLSFWNGILASAELAKHDRFAHCVIWAHVLGCSACVHSTSLF